LIWIKLSISSRESNRRTIKPSRPGESDHGHCQVDHLHRSGNLSAVGGRHGHHVWRLAKTLFQTGRLKNALPDFDHRHIALFASIHKGAPAQTLEQDIDE
jgi:hypothetical protein